MVLGVGVDFTVVVDAEIQTLGHCRAEAGLQGKAIAGDLGPAVAESGVWRPAIAALDLAVCVAELVPPAKPALQLDRGFGKENTYVIMRSYLTSAAKSDSLKWCFWTTWEKESVCTPSSRRASAQSARRRVSSGAQEQHKESPGASVLGVS